MKARDWGLCGFASSPSRVHVRKHVLPPVEGREIWLVVALRREPPEDTHTDTIPLGKEPVLSLCSPLVEQEVVRSHGAPSHDDRREKQNVHDVHYEKQASHDGRRERRIADVRRIRRKGLEGDRPASKPLARRKRS